MARLPRLVLPGIAYHVTQRGNPGRRRFSRTAIMRYIATCWLNRRKRQGPRSGALLDAYVDGKVDLFIGLAGKYDKGLLPDARLFKVDPSIFLKDQSLRTPGALIKIKP
jgi:hypothetical protein